MQTLIYRMDKQQGHTVEHGELYSVSCDKPQWKRIYTCNWLTLLYSGNKLNSVNQLHFNDIKKKNEVTLN